MALHGRIQVNNCEIAGWYAQRIDNFALAEETSLYHCWYEVVNDYDEIEEVTLATVEHRHADGSAALVAKVMQLAEGGWSS